MALAGCGGAVVDQDEWSFLDKVFRQAGALKGRYAEFGEWGKNAERGPDFVSYHYDPSHGRSIPLFSQDQFWFKISLSKKPVDPFDLQPPVVTVYMPRFQKYLKLRIVTADQGLAEGLARIFYREAVQAGGTNVRWGGKSSGNRAIHM